MPCPGQEENILLKGGQSVNFSQKLGFGLLLLQRLSVSPAPLVPWATVVLPSPGLGTHLFHWFFVLFIQSLFHVCLQPNELQHAMLFYPPLPPGVCSNACSLTRWCCLTISSSAAPFSLCLQCFSTSGSFLSQLFAKYWSFSFSISLSNEYLELISFSIDWLDLLAV